MKYSCEFRQYNTCCCNSVWVPCVGNDCECCGYEEVYYLCYTNNIYKLKFINII